MTLQAYRAVSHQGGQANNASVAEKRLHRRRRLAPAVDGLSHVKPATDRKKHTEQKFATIAAVIMTPYENTDNNDDDDDYQHHHYHH